MSTIPCRCVEPQCDQCHGEGRLTPEGQPAMRGGDAEAERRRCADVLRSHIRAADDSIERNQGAKREGAYRARNTLSRVLTDIMDGVTYEMAGWRRKAQGTRAAEAQMLARINERDFRRDPVAAVRDALNTVRAAFGGGFSFGLVLSTGDMEAVRANRHVADRFIHTGHSTGNLDALAYVFGVESVTVGDATEITVETVGARAT